MYHFVGVCSSLEATRQDAFSKNRLSRDEVADILNGLTFSWQIVAKFLKDAFYLRRNLNNLV